MKSDRALVAVFAALLAACGGAQSSDDAAAPSVAAFEADYGDDGVIRVDAPAGTFDGGYFVLSPSNWPREAGEVPAIATGVARAEGEDVVLEFWANTASLGLPDLEAIPLDGPAAFERSKLLSHVESVSDGFVVIDRGEGDGVTAGDYYFVLTNEAVAEERFGARVRALLSVTETAEKTAVARVVHSREDIAEGAVAVFAQASFELPTRNATVLIAPFERDGAGTDDFPAIADAMPEYLARFNLTNIGVEAFPTFLDPRPYDAAERASEAAESDYGALVFGELDRDTLVFNATAFGHPPHPGTTVGILPGGLPLPVGESLAQLSRQLAPSFIATVLALRGDHALAAYFLETVLAEESLEAEVRYHLREHLALRYESLNRTMESMRIMTHDVEAARADDATYSVLNALSIRSHLAAREGLSELFFADSVDFIETAEGVLPAESLGHELLSKARALLYLDRTDEAEEVVREVVDAARAVEDIELELDALIELALAAANTDASSARLVLAGAGSLLEGMEDDAGAVVHLLDAEFAVEAEDHQAALIALGRALDGVADSPVGPLRASVYRRAASVFLACERPAEAVVSLQEAAMLYLDSAQLERASAALVDLSFLKLHHSSQLAAGAAMQSVIEARQHIVLGAELALRIGFPLDAARSFLWASAIEREIGQDEAADYLLDRAERLALDAGHFPTLYELYTERAESAEAAGDASDAAEYQALAAVFGRAAGVEVEAEPVSTTSE